MSHTSDTPLNDSYSQGSKETDLIGGFYLELMDCGYLIMRKITLIRYWFMQVALFIYRISGICHFVPKLVLKENNYSMK